MRIRLAIIGLAAAAASGCGGSAGDGASSTAWDGTKACDTLKQADVARVMGQKVAPGTLETMHAGGGGLAAVSTCTYALTDGRTLSFLSRVSSGESLESAVAAVKNPPADMGTGVLTDVPGIGKAALWNEAVLQLQFWLDGDHHGIVTLTAPGMAGGDPSAAKAQAIALARAAGA